MKTKISLQELKKAYFPDANDIEDVFKNANINRYSIWKPTSCHTDINKLNLNHIKEAKCSLTPTSIPDLLISINGYYESLGYSPEHFENLDYNWKYKRPGGSEIDPYRIGDFRNYNPNALPPLFDDGTIVISRVLLEGITSKSKVNFKMYSRFSDMTWGLKGKEDPNMLPLNYVLDNLNQYRLGVVVYIPETEKWELFVSDILDEYPDDDEVLYNPDGTLQEKQYLNRLPKFSSNIPAVKLILDSAYKKFTYIPCLVKDYTNDIKSASIYSFPYSKPCILKIEDFNFDPGLANDCPDLYLDHLPDNWVAALVYERDENGLIYVERYGVKYYRSTCYLLNKTNPQYLTNNFEITWYAEYMSATVLHENQISIGLSKPSGTPVSFSNKIVINNKTYYSKELFRGWVDISSFKFSYYADIDYFKN
jgi:hypothetical protein